MVVAAWLIGPVGSRAGASTVTITPGPLTGVFSITSGTCNLVGPPTNSYVELVEHNVPVPNANSPCPLTSDVYTPLHTGVVGLVSGAYQLDPAPTFDGSGNSLAGSIVNPVKFLGEGFGLATTCAAQQLRPTPTGACPAGVTSFPAPELYGESVGSGGCKVNPTNLSGALDECLYGNLAGLGVTYNGTHDGTCVSASADNNGCYDTGVVTGAGLTPTSCGSAPLGGCSLSGTLNPLSGAYVLNMRSTIQGTSFDGATAIFHLEGTYKPGIPSNPSGTNNPAGGTASPASPPATTAPSPTTQGGTSGRAMTGQFQIAPGSCNGSSAPNGSWIQLGLGGGPIDNSSSQCDGGAYTPLSPGIKGLETGQFEPNPTPTFDANANSLAGAIITPTMFLGSKFGAATNAQDEQNAPNGPGVFPVPQAVLNGTQITANLSAINFTYNGSPNSTCASDAGDGCYSVGSFDVAGNYDPSTRAYTMQWTATVHGGAFNNATATFHLTGTFNGTISSASSTLSQAGNDHPTASSGFSAPETPAGAISPGGLAPPRANELIGTFSIAAGSCHGAGAPNGSWIQLSKGGSPIPNPDSVCAGGNYTPVSQGSVGLQTGHFQQDPTPTFDASGNSVSGAIIRPTKFLGTDFGAATDPDNEQSSPNGPAVFPAPYAVLTPGGTGFTANLSSINFTYNGTPNGTCASGRGVGCYSVGSADVVGTYDQSSHAYTMAWSGQVVGGAFSGATARFHFAGRFTGSITQIAASTVPAEAVRKSLPGSGAGAFSEGIASLLVAALIVAFAIFGPDLQRKRSRGPS